MDLEYIFLRTYVCIVCMQTPHRCFFLGGDTRHVVELWYGILHCILTVYLAVRELRNVWKDMFLFLPDFLSLSLLLLLDYLTLEI